jgi:hypothetical protein
MSRLINDAVSHADSARALMVDALPHCCLQEFARGSSEDSLRKG